MTDNAPLLTTVDAFARDLLADASESAEGSSKPSLDERVAVLKAVTSYLAVKNRLEPPPEEKSPLAQFQRDLAPADKPNGRTPRYRRDTVASNETLAGNA